MKPKKRGMKRHTVLQPLSRHHMEALYLGVKLRRAGTEKSTLTKEELIHEVKSFWNPNGERHFREEEEILLPTYAKYGDIEQKLIVDMLLEHVRIRSLVKTITTETVDVETLHTLGELLETHIRKEERIIFPMIEKALPEDVLQEMAPYIHD
ncbi:MAG TPA: hemerythrin domain-containing protein [Pseudogracilibacillus sp.]|nr:hemerythrin domain-containing protein [Pseudogracilibacillus sp.]